MALAITAHILLLSLLVWVARATKFEIQSILFVFFVGLFLVVLPSIVIPIESRAPKESYLENPIVATIGDKHFWVFKNELREKLDSSKLDIFKIKIQTYQSFYGFDAATQYAIEY